MNNKLNNMLKEFLSNADIKDDNDLEAKYKEFIEKYNNDEIEYENTPLDDAYELLDKAQESKSKTQAMNYAKKAYKTCPECFDALLFLADLEENPIKRWKLLDEGLKSEKERLEKGNYFNKEDIGHFYSIFETRPYIRGLFYKLQYLIVDGKIKQALSYCKEVLRLNEHDNLGARYYLMAIYAYLEDKEIIKLYQKFPEENLEMLLPLFIYYYKEGNDEKAKYYLKKVNEANPHFIKLFDDTFEEGTELEMGSYIIGEPSEVISYINRYDFLLDSVPTLPYYVHEYSKRFKH